MTGAMLAIALSVSLTTPSPVTSLMMPRNAKIAAGLCRDRQVRVWSMPDAKLLRTFAVTKEQIALTAISDDGRWIMVSDYRGSVVVYDSSTGQPQLEQHIDHYVTAAAFSRDSRLLAIAPGNERVRIIDVAAKRVTELEHSVFIGALAFSSDGKSLAAADGDGVRIFDTATGRRVSRNDDFVMSPLTVDFTADGKQAIAAGAEKVVVFFDAASGKTLRRAVITDKPVFYVGVAPDSKQLLLATFDADNMDLPTPVVICEVESLLKIVQWTPPASVVGGTWTPDSHLIVATADKDAVSLWQVR